MRKGFVHARTVGEATNFLYDGGAVLLEKQGSVTTATYTYDSALVRKDGEYPLFDGLGSEQTVTNSSQTVTGTLTQDGFGNTVASTGSNSNPYVYAATSGYRNDGDAGLMHVGEEARQQFLVVFAHTRKRGGPIRVYWHSTLSD